MIRQKLLGKVFVAAYVSFFASSISAADTDALNLPAQASIQAAFAPWDDIEGIIKDCIDQAERQVLVQAYLLSNKKISAALVSAKRRGLDVRILADATKHAELPSSRLGVLASEGIKVWLETDYENAHNKVIVIDAATPQAIVITRSFNFTCTAQHRNAENILVVRNHRALAARYEMNWLRHQTNAVSFK